MTRQLLTTIPGIAGALGIANFGRLFIVDPNGNYTRSSLRHRTIQSALDAAEAGDTIMITPGDYDEQVSVARAKQYVTITGLGNRGAVCIAPQVGNKTGLTILADDVTVINVGCAGAGTGSGVLNYGDRTRMKGCKIEGGTNGLLLTLASVLQEAADTHGTGADTLFEDCEICWNTNGVKLVGTDYGAVTQTRFRGCTFHDNSAADFEEATGAGGAIGLHFKDLDLKGCTFLRQEDGTEPAKYLLLNDDNGNKGVVAECSFPTAINGGKNLVSTGLIWVSNRHTGGISAAQPS